jgi:hypothetical protein
MGFFQTQNQFRVIVPGKSTSIIELSEDIEAYHCLFAQDSIDTFAGRSRLMESLSFLNMDASPLIELPSSTAVFFEATFAKLFKDYIKVITI